MFDLIYWKEALKAFSPYRFLPAGKASDAIILDGANKNRIACDVPGHVNRLFGFWLKTKISAPCLHCEHGAENLLQEATKNTSCDLFFSHKRYLFSVCFCGLIHFHRDHKSMNNRYYLNNFSNALSKFKTFSL